jgi:hypothetical protein
MGGHSFFVRPRHGARSLTNVGVVRGAEDRSSRASTQGQRPQLHLHLFSSSQRAFTIYELPTLSSHPISLFFSFLLLLISLSRHLLWRTAGHPLPTARSTPFAPSTNEAPSRLRLERETKLGEDAREHEDEEDD